MGGVTISKDEKLLVLECRDRTEFAKKYIEKFGLPSKIYRIDNIWSMRKAIKDELVPNFGAGTQTFPRAERERKSDYDEGELLYRLTVLFAEHLQVTKEMLELFKKLDKTGVKDGTDATKESGTGHG
jgi:hypothetical protein